MVFNFTIVFKHNNKIFLYYVYFLNKEVFVHTKIQKIRRVL